MAPARAAAITIAIDSRRRRGGALDVVTDCGISAARVERRAPRPRAASAHPKAISERMGHSEIGVTMNVYVYGHLFQDKQE